MSLNRKYTWKDFLVEHPEFREKKVKRTSSEGKKAFEAAYKAKIREILKERLGWIEKEIGRANKEREKLINAIKVAKKGTNKRRIQVRIGTQEKYIHRLGKVTERTKQIQKSI